MPGSWTKNAAPRSRRAKSGSHGWCRCIIFQKAHPDAGEFRIWSLLAQPDISARTVGRIMALNNKKGVSMATFTEREQAYFGPRTDKPPGSVAWCWQTILLMQTRWHQKTIDEAGFQALVDELTAHEAWNVVPPEQPYGSLDALMMAEIGQTVPEVQVSLSRFM